MLSEPRIEDRQPQHYLAVRAQVTMQDLASAVELAFPEVFAYLAKQGVAPAGAPLIRDLVIDMARALDVAIGVPVAAAVDGAGRVSGGVLPAGRYATLVYTGDYSGLVDANAALLDWGARQGLVWDQSATDAGDAFGGRVEFYLSDPRLEPDSSKWQTEVAIRLADDRSGRAA
ncbi:MAG: GyrI-like domain-containing protein [Chloroflexota bacterium]